MPIFLDTRGKSTLGIGICGRCSRKMSLDDLYPDPNYPGLRVCRDDIDDYDPYRLPARQPEVIALQYPRPDVPLIDGVRPYADDLSRYDYATYGHDVFAPEPYSTGIWFHSLWGGSLWG